MSLSASSVDPSAMLSCLNSSSLGSSTLLPSLPPLAARETDDRYSDSAFVTHSLLSKVGDQLTEFITNSNQQTTSSNSLLRSVLDRLERMENALESHFTDLTDAVKKRRSSSTDPESPRSSKRPRSSTPAQREQPDDDEDEAEKKRQADQAAADEAEKKKQQDLLDEIRREEEAEAAENDRKKKQKAAEDEARRQEEEAQEAKRKQREELKKKLQASTVSSKR